MKAKTTGRTGRLACAARAFIARFAEASHGNIAMMFGLTLPVLLMISLGAIDLHQASKVKAQLQDALDAASLAAARSTATTSAGVNTVGMAALKANMPAYFKEGGGDTASFTLVGGQLVVATAKVDVKVLVANVFLPPYGQLLDDYLPVAASTEVNRPTKDIEVSLVLDITGSMEGSRLSDLQKAANGLVDMLIEPAPSINRTRMALAPYSMGVNATDYLTAVRGAARGSTAISGAAWMVAGTQKTVSGVSKANPGVFTAVNHGYKTDDFVWISGVTDAGGSGTDLAGALNNRAYRVVKINADTFNLQRWSGTAWVSVSTSGTQTYTASSGIARRCLASTCEVVVTTSGDHGLSTGENVRIADVRGMTQINTQTTVAPSGSAPFNLTVARQSATTFSINGFDPTKTLSAYSSGGSVQCLEYGCQKYLFTNNENNLRVFDASSCVSERVGAEAYTDASPSTAKTAFSYVGTTNVGQGGCMTTKLTPLTNDITTLKGAINGYKAEGGTAGQIGVAWGWYMVSPTFGSVFPASSQPAAYGTRGLIKVVVIMTDGEFNAVYYNGVRARDSGTGGGSNDRWINHDSNNGNPFQQAVNLCAGMREQGIIVYTVGFDVGDGQDATPGKVDSAAEVMQVCASSPQHVYLPKNGTSLQTAFNAIGRSISQLRISK
ncbi:ubiquitin-activating E1 FCCH domain-containing protein [Brevundimonas faecalis]|uniref:ubiquitin-activating E1 FCCH domain-containing protein n=1 Tax=Brevundimonas faecalis TaxID=947378 RepID=UPI003605E83F